MRFATAARPERSTPASPAPAELAARRDATLQRRRLLWSRVVAAASCAVMAGCLLLDLRGAAGFAGTPDASLLWCGLLLAFALVSVVPTLRGRIAVARRRSAPDATPQPEPRRWARIGLAAASRQGAQPSARAPFEPAADPPALPSPAAPAQRA